MDLLTVAIIYFACGSPIVMHFVLSNEQLNVHTAIAAVLRALIWPVFATYLLIDAVGHRRISQSQARLALARDVRDEFESEIVAGTLPTEIFAFRDIFDRYFALNDATLAEEINNGTPQFLAISDHPNIDLAKVCFDRKMKVRVQEHARDARADIAEMLRTRSFSQPSITKLIELTGDRTLFRDLDNLANLAAEIPHSTTRKAA